MSGTYGKDESAYTGVLQYAPGDIHRRTVCFCGCACHKRTKRYTFVNSQDPVQRLLRTVKIEICRA